MFKNPPVPFTTWDEYRAARDAFYLSPEWQEIRKQVIRNSDGRCVYCKRFPTRDNPINIDHRIPLCKRWDLRLCLNNLQLTCQACNIKKSGMSHKRMLRKISGGAKKKKGKKKMRAERLRAKQERQRKKDEKQKRINASFWSTYLK